MGLDNIYLLASPIIYLTSKENHMPQSFGTVVSPSTSRTLKILATKDSAKLAIVGRMIYLDFTLDDGEYRALGTVADMITDNINDRNTHTAVITAAGGVMPSSADTRTATVNIQAVFRKSKEVWKQYGATMPNSPNWGAAINILGPEEIDNLIANSEETVHVGTVRGMSTVPAPFILPNFDSQRGASSSGTFGRTGSGKTAFASLTLCAQMKHENHAIIVIDPQGQWNNENGFIISPQKWAASLGREVHTLRVSEDIKLPLHYESISTLMDELNIWDSFRRMGKENKQIFSETIAKKITRKPQEDINSEPRKLLSDIFASIAVSQTTLSRIYSTPERQESLKSDLCALADIEYIDPKTELERVLNEEELEDYEESWESILKKFSPFISLFSSKNINGQKRIPLAGENGFLSQILQVRGKNPAKPAPYVILDMSPNVENNAKASYAAGTGVENAAYGMQKVLDTDNVKASILAIIFDEIKTASERAFASGNGNLNTQILFDEAWRYAPSDKSSVESVEYLANALEGYALDTRKFGVGWTYILQSPSDLRRGIWNQLTYVYAGHGLGGKDLSLMNEKLDDGTEQLKLYQQFASPTATGVYPFMVTGPVSPLVFTSAPTFVDAYNDINAFIEDNRKWIDVLTEKRFMPPLTLRGVSVGGNKVKASRGSEKPAQAFSVGSTKSSSQRSQPQSVPVVVKPVIEPETNNGFPSIDLPPF